MKKLVRLSPIQPFFTSYTSKYYKMYKPDSPIVHYYWFHADTEKPLTIAVPDGCIDILFALDDHDVKGRVYGSVTKSTPVDIFSGYNYLGVRFEPGQIPRKIDISIPELIDTHVPFDIFNGGRELSDRIGEASDIFEQMNLIHKYINNQWRQDEQLCSMISLIASHQGNARISELANEMQYSTRYINRVFTSRLGLSPKTFSKFMRFQSLISLINEFGDDSFTDIAYHSGYYDQSHSIKEFKEFASVTPHEYAHKVDLPNYWNRIIPVSSSGVPILEKSAARHCREKL